MIHLTAIIVFFLGFLSSYAAMAEVEPQKVPILYDKLYSVVGFDSNDQVQIVTEGTFKNSCYRSATPTVDVDAAAKTIHVGPAAYEYSGMCLQIVLPFHRVIDIGILKPGTWTVVQGPEKKKLGEVVVRTAVNDSADDYLYAPVSQAFFSQTETAKEVVISGEYPSNCFAMDDVQVAVEKDAIVIQPVVKVENREGCEMGRFPFQKKIVLRDVAQGRYLLHVRAMNANAVNSLVTVR